MAFPTLQYSKNKVSKAGSILIKDSPREEDLMWANKVLENWRACHGYPINTFNSTLRNRLNKIDRHAIVAQRLKRAPSIINKLKRFKSMQLSRMQDIGGLRAIVSSLRKVNQVVKEYTRPGGFEHELITTKNYIENPKQDGYRCIHLIYRYQNKLVPKYNGLMVELQVRTKLQHAWATAVETMGTFLKQSLKSSQGEEKWLDYFKLVGSAFAHIERTTPVPGYENFSKSEIFKKVKKIERDLKVLDMLKGFSLAADFILDKKGQKAYTYHLINLNYEEKTITLQAYGRDQLHKASKAYAELETKVSEGEASEVVLVSVGSVNSLKKAYPNYFLDTKEFIKNVSRIIQ